ncbi:MAG: hypothetical protein AABX28_03795 [Nanoarchaeota archaeon]
MRKKDKKKIEIAKKKKTKTKNSKKEIEKLKEKRESSKLAEEVSEETPKNLNQRSEFHEDVSQILRRLRVSPVLERTLGSEEILSRDVVQRREDKKDDGIEYSSSKEIDYRATRETPRNENRTQYTETANYSGIIKQNKTARESTRMLTTPKSEWENGTTRRDRWMIDETSKMPTEERDEDYKPEKIKSEYES